MNLLAEYKIKGYPKTLRPSFAALLAIQRKTEKPLSQIASELEKGRIDIVEIVALGWGFSFEDAKETIDYEEAGRIMVEVGIVHFLAPISSCLVASIQGPSEKKTGHIPKS